MKSVKGKKAFSEASFRKELGARIQELRKRGPMTQERLAELVEVSPSFIGPIERGEKLPSLVTLAKIAQALEVPVYQLFMVDSEIAAKEKYALELMDFLKTRPARDTKILLALERELSKQCP